MSDDVANAPAPEGKYMVDTYENWARAEGVPVHEGFALDLVTLTTKTWARMGVAGAMCHLSGRCDYLTMWLLDIPGSANCRSSLVQWNRNVASPKRRVA